MVDFGRLIAILAVVAAVTASAAGATGRASESPTRAALVCELVDIVIPLDCTPGTPARSESQASSQTAEPSTPAAKPVAAAQGKPAAATIRRSSGVPRYDPKRLTITFRQGISRRRIEGVLTQAGVTLEQAVPAIRAYMVGVEPSRRARALELLRASSAVADAGRELLVQALATTPNDDDWAEQWGLRLAGFPRVWSQSSSASRITVAVVDTGVDSAQSDLQGVVVPGYDFVNHTPDPRDDVGHGTAVAGIIAARTDNREGIAGICPSCSIMPIKVLDRTGNGDDTVVAAGIVWAADHGAQVINLSLGGPGSTPELAAALAYARSKGAILVAAAGNDGTTTPFYPAADSNAISVGASDDRDKPYPWSNRGPWVSLTAPGCNPAPNLEGGYDDFCGTSSATPVVSGLVALAVAASPAATRDQVETAVERTAVPIGSLIRYGRIDAPATLSFLGAPVVPTPVVPTSTTFRGDLHDRVVARSYRLTATDGQLTARLAFAGKGVLTLTLTPAAGSSGAARVSGPSPLKLSTPVTAGPIRLTVRGRGARGAFVLTVSIRAQA